MKSENTTLIPVFMPTLAVVLALAERHKGSPLTQAEAESIRDRSTCVMMEPADAAKLAQSHGYVDVNPQNCWADWHRLRVQMTGNGCLPKIVLCIPGDANFRDRCEPILKAANAEYEFQPRDERLLNAFKASSMTRPSFTSQDYAQIEAHATVLYVLSANFTAAAAEATARTFLKLGRQLLDAGPIGIKSESSGISHSRARWAQFDEQANGDAFQRWRALFDAYVVFPIGSTTDLYTCGMHLLGAPDLIISEPTIRNSAKADESTASTAAQLFRTFAIYLLGECPTGKFASGHTFSADRESPRYRLVWEPCTEYGEDNFFFNPFGYWRFTTP